MPTDSNLLGFSNIWYKKGIKFKTNKVLPNGTEIFVFSPAYYLASKFAAHKGRGGVDLRQSHDFEDIIYLFDNCSELLNNIENADSTVKTYLKEACQELLQNDNLTEGIECALPLGADSESPDLVLKLIQSISEIE